MMIEQLYENFLACNGVCTDSRACQEGNLFVCLKGENFDGNNFAEKAVEMGCKYVLTSRKDLLTSDESTNRLKLRLSESRSNVYIDYAEREQLHEGEARVIGESTLRQAQGQNIDSPNHQITESPYIYVEDTLAALQQLAAHHRKVLGTPIVGITGTNGKTTTKELVSAVLAKKYNVLYTLGNFNNHIGVPLTLLRLTKEHDMAVVEMGANHPGEIEFLANIVMPDAGLITNVGKAHLAGFGSFEGVKNTKAELYRNLLSRGKTVFIDADSPYLTKMWEKVKVRSEELGVRSFCASRVQSQTCLNYAEAQPKTMSEASNEELGVRSYGSDVALAVNGTVTSCTPFVNINLTIEGTTYPVQSQLIGAYNVSNMLSAACVGHYFGVSATDIADALSTYTPQNNRSQLTKTERNTLIIDAYNANPTSMEAALRNFALIQTEGKAVILGDMFELGDDSATEHQKVVSLLEQLGITEAYLLGKNFETTTGIGTRFASTPLFKEWLQAHPLSGKTLLIKGSNSMKLTTLIDAL